ncbi:MAG: hypothetical protein PHZ04_04145 [Patescibacteria group bacterium]|nr:hypothetical protein [Patescibacteria group bacterium]MDD5554013.1 hypothetical protein [Patescibacteria group bacterium]
MILLKKAALFIFFALLFLSFAKSAAASQVSSPTIIQLGDKRGQEFSRQLFIKGLTPANTEVLVYIDGVYADFAKVGSEGTASDSFYYEHPTALAGGNEIMLIARDKTSLVLSPPVEIKYIIPPLPAPTLISPASGKIIGEPKPYITGLVSNWSFAHVYIDGVYNGRTKILSHESGTANFAYKPFLDLEVGLHKVWAIAEDDSGRKSGVSNILEFLVQKPMPAPTLFSPVVNSRTKYNQPFIVGLSKNDSFIKVFIDNELNGQFEVDNHSSGTANFAFKPPVLARGNHSVYATATDNRGKESRRSNTVYFSVRQPVISKGAGEEKGGLIGKIEEPVSGSGQELPLSISPTGDIERGKSISGEETAGVGSRITGEEKKTADLIDESEQAQGKLGVNLIVFIVFILGVIGWIFWVNRELVKEQRAGEKSQEDFFSEGKKEDNSSDNSGENKLF